MTTKAIERAARRNTRKTTTPASENSQEVEELEHEESEEVEEVEPVQSVGEKKDSNSLSIHDKSHPCYVSREVNALGQPKVFKTGTGVKIYNGTGGKDVA